MDEKQVFEDSANEAPKKDDSDRAIEEEVGEAYSEVGHSRPGFTKLDRRDMYRMGKIQELKVCYHVVDTCTCLTLEKSWADRMTAQLSGSLYLFLCGCSYRSMGISIDAGHH
jgi:hypothetical protein